MIRTGSSPRGRGTRTGICRSNRSGRFIPAWAGNTAHDHRDTSELSVHPRVGGEHVEAPAVVAVTLGSSPRGRGTRARTGGHIAWYRFIPAWAGNTGSRKTVRLKTAVHPRVGGEHFCTHTIERRKFGSSPRGRGTRTSTNSTATRLRFIPAWAGNTVRQRRSTKQASVHPRVGGEHGRPGVQSSAVLGSSPRGRGTHRSEAVAMTVVRFIPAWAGNTLGRARTGYQCITLDSVSWMVSFAGYWSSISFIAWCPVTDWVRI